MKTASRVMSSELVVSLAGAAHFWAPPRIGQVLVSVKGAASCKGREQSRCSWLESSAWVQGRRLAEVDVLTLSIPDLVMSHLRSCQVLVVLCWCWIIIFCRCDAPGGGKVPRTVLTV
ncbi:hypothetical protein J6590_052751 [Homalodisca vitripennis]|nr:hypothetical protein J6590_052751 [Homalodisca vitripennis]